MSARVVQITIRQGRPAPINLGMLPGAISEAKHNSRK
jgi:hypothetical protein